MLYTDVIAQVSTISLFGFVFSALSEMGYPTAVFLANGVRDFDSGMRVMLTNRQLRWLVSYFYCLSGCHV
jgi:hypothetical protein